MRRKHKKSTLNHGLGIEAPDIDCVWACGILSDVGSRGVLCALNSERGIQYAEALAYASDDFFLIYREDILKWIESADPEKNPDTLITLCHSMTCIRQRNVPHLSMLACDVFCCISKNRKKLHMAFGIDKRMDEWVAMNSGNQ